MTKRKTIRMRKTRKINRKWTSDLQNTQKLWYLVQIGKYYWRISLGL
jgi:hypothetical protein